MKKRKCYKGTIKCNQLKVSEGGQGLRILKDFKAASIKAVGCHSPYVGNVGILVTVNNKKQAETASIILGWDKSDAYFLLSKPLMCKFLKGEFYNISTLTFK